MALNLNSSLNINSGSLNITQTPRTSVVYVSGLIFSASVDNVELIGNTFSVTSSIITLDTASATFDRVDAIVAELSSSVGARITNITGTASADAAFPILDPENQIPLKYVKVKANATTPSSAGVDAFDQKTPEDFETVLVYNEGTGLPGEWSTGSAQQNQYWSQVPGNTYQSTEEAYNGTYSIKTSLKKLGGSTRGSGYFWSPRLRYDITDGNQYQLGRIAGFSFYIKLKTNLIASQPYFNAGITVSKANSQGQYYSTFYPNNVGLFTNKGINLSDTTNWQYVTFSVTDFGGGDLINQFASSVVEMFQIGAAGGSSVLPDEAFVYIDYIQMHLGSLPASDPNNSGGPTGNTSTTAGTGVYKQGDTSFSIIPTNALSCVTSDFSTIGGGQNNKITSSQYSYIGAGQNNILASGSNYSSILGGSNNTSSYENSFIIGSNLTSNKACYTFMNNLDVAGVVSGSIFSGSFIGDGSNLTGISGSGSTNTGSLLTTASVSSNTITFTKGDNSTFNIIVNTGSGGGGGNSITVQDNGTPLTTDLSLLNFVGATVTEPTADNVTVTIGSGLYEAGTGACSIKPTIGSNTVAAPTSSIAGGELNNISCVNANSSHNFIGGGKNNLISGSFAGVIVGGGFNTLTTGSSNSVQIYDFIGGGNENTAGGGFSSVVGGANNEATGCVSGIFGGSGNKALSCRSTIMGGQGNIVSGSVNSAILGGNGNCVYTTYTGDGMGEFILGGKSNVISGPDASCSTIIGGRNNTITHRNSHIIGGTSFVSQEQRTTYVENLHITSSVDQANAITSILTLNRREITPDSPLEGMIMASGSAGSSKLYYYNGSSWNSLF